MSPLVCSLRKQPTCTIPALAGQSQMDYLATGRKAPIHPFSKQNTGGLYPSLASAQEPLLPLC